jgi:hypothetical protein
MRKLFLVLILGMLLVFPSLAFAQEQIVIESASMEFWPEYDDPDMLVISYIALDPNGVFPVTFNIRIPADARPHVIAVGDALDMVSDQNIKYEIKPDGSWQVISIEATAPAVQVEYYDPMLKKDGMARAYNYQWSSDYEVKKFLIGVQQPFDASNVKSSLDLVDEGIHQNGLRYYSYDAGAIKPGKSFSFNLSYDKASDILSTSQIEASVQPAAPLDDTTPGRVSMSNALPYIIGVLGLLLIVGGVVYYLQAGKKTSGKKSRRRASGNPDEESDGGDVYCSQCGTRARGGDRFCRTCGSRLRQAED